MEIFKASVQYNDLKGSSAADRADMIDATEFLKSKGLITNEHIIGISMFVGENHGKHEDPIFVSFLVTPLVGHNTIPEMLEASSDLIKIKEIQIQMGIAEFLALFKRLEITLSPDNMIEGKTYIKV